MSFIPELEGLPEGYQLNRGQLATYVRAGLDQGASANGMLRYLQEQGQGIRRQSFLQLVQEVRGATAMAGEWATGAMDTLPDVGQIVQWSGGAQDTYLYRTYVYYRQSEGDDLTVYRKGISIQTSELITPEEALSSVQDLLNEGSESDNYSNQEVLGIEFAGVYHQLGAA